jgi:ABC transport system ATP-binding/permease protein
MELFCKKFFFNILIQNHSLLSNLMSLLTVQNLQIAFGHVALLDGVSFSLERGERICLIGRNGEGKSTLMKILAEQVRADDGKVELQSGCKIAYLAQEPAFDPEMTVFHTVAEGLGEIGVLVETYHNLITRLSHENNDAILKHLEEVQHQLEAQDGWRLEQKVNAIISRLELPADQKMSALSGGWKRRVALAQILVTEPDVLLLDEPTNHLDIEMITWLEELLKELTGGLLFVSHDRAFMQKVATRIIELDRGKLSNYLNDYDTYLKVKQATLEAEATQAAKFDKFLAQEEVWIRQGIKARRTRNEGRVRRLEALRIERSLRREQIGKMKLNISQAEISGKLVIEVENLCKSFDEQPIVKQFSTLILRGDRIGLIGNNGAGKTTLLKLLLGELQPDSGTVKHGTQLNILYFDQLRTELDPELTLFETIGQGRDSITINGQTKHVISYLGDFLFSAARARSPVKSLSGGERNRLLLARLFAKPSNVLVMDEPTNDLDVESLELLEDVLADYQGTLLLVSHDRQFLDNVVTSTFAFEGNGKVVEYVGGYADWVRQRPKNFISQSVIPTNKVAQPIKTTPAPQVVPQISTLSTKRKLSYKEQRELAELPEKIDTLETQLGELQTLVNQPEFYRQSADQTTKILNQIKELENNLAEAYQRWQALES